MTTFFDKCPTEKKPVSRELMASILNTARLLDAEIDSDLLRFDGYSPEQSPKTPSYTDYWIETEPHYMAEYYKPSFLELEEPRGTTIVHMNQEGQLVVPAGEAGRIATFGLGGCTAVAVLGTFADGSHRAHVQHYDAFAKRHDVEAPSSLEEAILQREALVGDYAQATRVDAVIMVPGFAYVKPSDPTHTAWLTETIHDQFGDKVSVHISPYSAMMQNGESPYAHTLLVDIPREGPVNIRPGLSRIIID